MQPVIDQQKNYSAQFGFIFRSSAIFYIARDVKTTISVSNYWHFKNNLEISLLFSIRDLNGELVERREKNFDVGMVINDSTWPVKEGSVEVEAYGNKNLRIPYAAVMGIYETKTSISMVHSYGRNHNLIEIEDGNSLTSARESCWTIRKDTQIVNKAIFHNGHLCADKQKAKFILINHDGKEESIDFNIPKLKPFETYVFEVESLLSNFREHLGTSDGWGALHFENSTAFTRLLLLWQNKKTGEVQVTHSNFDYSEIETNKIESKKPALMKWPSILSKSKNARVVVYPKFSRGKYEISSSKKTIQTDKGLITNTIGISELSFSLCNSSMLPSRIVTGFQYSKVEDALPLECSTGIYHEKRPPKRFHWTVASIKYRSQLFFNSFPEIYETPKDMFVVFRLYTKNKNEFLERHINLKSLSEIPDGIYIDELFDRDPNLDTKDFCYISMFSNFGGFLMYSSMQKKSSITIEHSF